MSRFNKAAVSPSATTNLAGGAAFAENPKMELVSLLSTSFGEDKFYQTSKESFERLEKLLGAVDPLFAAKAIFYARKELGMRTITHVATALLAPSLSGSDWAKKFFTAVVHRPDDMMEIVSYSRLRGIGMTKALQKGFAKAFDKFDGYQLAKYKGEGKAVKLLDIVNLVHPKETEKNKEALWKLMRGQLVSTGTFQAELSKAGQVAESEEEKAELKGAAWASLINDRKIGYLQLLRNLRNIYEQSPGALDAALTMLTEERLIRKSLVMPFQYMVAYKEILKINGGPQIRQILGAIDDAVEISIGNLPKFVGRNLVVLDVSSSMNSVPTGQAYSPAEIGSLFTSAIAKAANADVMTFDRDARYLSYNPRATVMQLAREMPFVGGATYFHTIFQRANAAYDRIFILSDMQGYNPNNYLAPFKDSLAAYKRKFQCNPKIFSFDLAGYGQLMLPEPNIYCIAGFSDKTIGLIESLDRDKDALIKTIEKIEF